MIIVKTANIFLTKPIINEEKWNEKETIGKIDARNQQFTELTKWKKYIGTKFSKKLEKKLSFSLIPHLHLFDHKIFEKKINQESGRKNEIFKSKKKIFK